MKTLKRVTAIVIVAGLFSTSIYAAPVNSTRVDVTLQATILNSLTVVVANPAVAFGVVATGTSNAAPLGQALAITTAWNLGPGVSVKLYAYFDSAASALSGVTTGQLIPTSAVTGTVNGGSPQTFTTTSPFTSGATALSVFSIPVSSSNLVVTRTDSLALALDLTGLVPQADTYVGTLHLQAQAV